MSDLTAKLAAPLDAARVRTRTDGRGGSLSYLETHDVIRTANELFGFGKWGHDVVELRSLAGVTVHSKDGKAGTAVGYICVVRLTVDGCVPMSGVGFGDATEYRESAAVTAHELAAKEAESDALKRALKNFGDQFGLALYDKHASRAGHIAETPPPEKKPAVISREQVTRFHTLREKHGVSPDRGKELLRQITGQESSAAIPKALYDAVIAALQAEPEPESEFKIPPGAAA